MKKFKIWLILSLLIYAGISLIAGIFLHQAQQREEHAYRVEVSRVMQKLQQSNDIALLKLNQFQYITDIDYISEEADAKSLELFYMEDNKKETLIQPWLQDDKLMGYVKFYYQLPDYHVKILIVVEGSLMIMEGFLLIVLFSVRKHILLPFERLHALPQELAHRHFEGFIEIEKDAYFKTYLQGMSELQKELQVSRQRELALLKEKKSLLLSLSHDIKTPLNLIQLYGKALQEQVYKDKAEQLWAYHQIEAKGLEIETYVNTIMQSAREDILELQVSMGEFYLSKLMQSIIVIYQEKCKLRQIELSCASFEDRILKGDIDRAQEVLENILENALKYGDGVRIEISFDIEDECQLIHILSTGGMVSDHELNHLFDSFFRGENSSGKQGSGLGLYICRQLMGKMDGAIYAEKKYAGMQFTLVFR